MKQPRDSWPKCDAALLKNLSKIADLEPERFYRNQRMIVNATQSSPDYIFELFLECSLLRRDFAALEIEALRITEISMNASVIASQLSGGLRVYIEVAKQISHAAQHMQQRIHAMKIEVSAIVNLTLRARIFRRRLEKYRQACPMLKQFEARMLVARAAIAVLVKIIDFMRGIHAHIHPAHSLLKSLLQCQYRMVAALNALKIESISLPVHYQTSMIVLINELTSATDDGIGKLDGIGQRLSRITQLVELIEQSYRTEVVEARHKYTRRQDAKDSAA